MEVSIEAAPHHLYSNGMLAEDLRDEASRFFGGSYKSPVIVDI